MAISFPKVTPKITPLDSSELLFCMDRHTTAAKAYMPHRMRCMKNMKAYASLGTDQWSESLLTDLRKEGRVPSTYNFAQYIIDGVVGNYMMNWFDPKFNDREDDDVDATNAIVALQKKYYSDKKRFSYKQSSLRSTRNGCIFGGWEELVIDREVDPRGNVKFESVRPDMIIPDVHNVSDEISRKSKEIFKEFYLSASEMIHYFPNASGKIMDTLRGLAKDETEKADYAQPKVDSITHETSRFGKKYLVVSWYHMEYEKKNKVIDKNTLEELPDLGFEFGTEEDFVAKAMYAKSKNQTFDPNNIVVVQKSVPVLWCTTFCKDLAITLDNRKDERQLNGMMPFYCWAFMMVNGVTIGLMDLIIDAQDDINKREATKTKYLTQTPLGGKMWIHPTAFGTSGEEREEAIANMNDSTKPLILSPDVPEGLSSSLMGIMQGMQIPQGVLQDESVKIDFLSKIGRLPPAMQGFSEKSGESGILMGRKVIEGSIMQRVPMEFLLEKERQKATDYVTMTLKLMGSEDKTKWLANLNRKFKATDGTDVIINEVISTDEFGNPVEVKSDVTKLKSIEVDITESKENDFVRQMKRESVVASLQAIQPSPTNAGIRAELEAQLINSLDYATTQDREKAEEAAEKAREVSMAQTELTLMSINQQKQQITQMAMGGGAPPMPGEPPASASGTNQPTQPQVPEQAKSPVPELERTV